MKIFYLEKFSYTVPELIFIFFDKNNLSDKRKVPNHSRQRGRGVILVPLERFGAPGIMGKTMLLHELV
jgi:hypothetical protein